MRSCRPLPDRGRPVTETSMGWMRAAPVFPVADVAASVEWYVRVFGFEARIVNPPGEPNPSYAVLHCDETRLHLLRRDEAPHGLKAPVQAQFWVDSGLDALFARAESHRVEVLQRPETRPWGHRDFMVADPDGNVVWVTTPVA